MKNRNGEESLPSVIAIPLGTRREFVVVMPPTFARPLLVQEGGENLVRVESTSRARPRRITLLFSGDLPAEEVGGYADQPRPRTYIANARLLELAKKNRPPREWYEATDKPF